jgi:proline-rich protein PRCC
MLGLDDYGSDSDSSRPGSPRAGTTFHKSLPKSRRAPKKITIALPTISSKDDNEEEDFERPAKKRKTAGVSSLLSILPTPKQSIPVPPQRVLGRGFKGRGLAVRSQSCTESTTLAETTAQGDETESTSTASKADDLSKNPSTTLFRPTSLAKGRKNISVEEHSINQPRTEKPPLQKPSTSSEPAVDFFSIGELLCSFPLVLYLT